MGYHAQGLRRLVATTLGELRKNAGKDEEGLSVFFSTHPSIANRLQSLDAVRDEGGGKKGQWLAGRFRARTAGLN